MQQRPPASPEPSEELETDENDVLKIVSINLAASWLAGLSLYVAAEYESLLWLLVCLVAYCFLLSKCWRDKADSLSEPGSPIVIILFSILTYFSIQYMGVATSGCYLMGTLSLIQICREAWYPFAEIFQSAIEKIFLDPRPEDPIPRFYWLQQVGVPFGGCALSTFVKIYTGHNHPDYYEFVLLLSMVHDYLVPLYAEWYFVEWFIVSFSSKCTVWILLRIFYKFGGFAISILFSTAAVLLASYVGAHMFPVYQKNVRELRKVSEELKIMKAEMRKIKRGMREFMENEGFEMVPNEAPRSPAPDF
ncbi:unnamed protein product [Caenorhabditis sp. 36 PRJEB53466]|nr:unnamed protein product [Caenorhabditis sp. 36 PRJEB53466]